MMESNTSALITHSANAEEIGAALPHDPETYIAQLTIKKEALEEATSVPAEVMAACRSALLESPT